MCSERACSEEFAEGAGECLRDLLDLSARLLRVGGRLVYFLPTAPEVYREEEVPRHPALRQVSNSEQVLTARYSRRLITMEKVRANPLLPLFPGCREAAGQNPHFCLPCLTCAGAQH